MTALKKRPGRPAKDAVRVHMSMRADLWRRVTALAKDGGRTFTSQVERLLEEAMGSKK